MQKSDPKQQKPLDLRLHQAEKRMLFETKHEARHIFIKLRGSIRWIFASFFMGMFVGLYCSAFSRSLSFVTNLRANHPWLLFSLPFWGLAIVFLYRALRIYTDRGTNQVITAINGDDQVPVQTSVLIFVSTLLTHLGGGSAGREGAALQMGGSLGNLVANVIKEDTRDTKIFIMIGMSAAFSAIFGTPMAAVIFSMEVVSVGIMHYSALFSCTLASLTASMFAGSMGVDPEAFAIVSIPAFEIVAIIKIFILSGLIAALSAIFIKLLEYFATLYNHLFPNPYIRIFVGGVIFVLIVSVFGLQDYCGAGTNLIQMAVEDGDVPSCAFIIKMLLTCITLEAGFKGGELVPSFAIGAAFGCVFGRIAGISPSFCAAVGMITMFCAVTNCPISSLLISFELFGYTGIPFFMIAIATGYMLSGYKSLYKDQIIVYSKYRPRAIFRHSGDTGGETEEMTDRS